MEFCCGGGSEELGLVSAAWGQKNISGVINGHAGPELPRPAQTEAGFISYLLCETGPCISQDESMSFFSCNLAS